MPMSPRLLRPRKNLATPQTISGLSLWLYGDDPGMTISTGVSVWPDRSGKNRNATQSTAGKQPINTNTINGRKVVTFQGVDDTMEIAAASDFNATSQTIFIVSRQTSLAFAVLWHKAANSAVTNGVIVRYRLDGAIWLYQKGSGSPQTLTTYAATNTNLNVFSIVLQPTSQQGWVNGTSRATASDAQAYGNNSSIWLGSRMDEAEFLAGDIAEIIYYNRALSTSERRTIEQYLSKRWGVAVA